ncbi:MAG: Holliday junction branch migration protein RuvA [Treponema lecithinolyticum]|uniref:Holliday junction branch migration protein RuvA n=1 Tax=Treponema lecithinolyticum TaxID=53418 RepID=UPI003FA21281
MFNSITGIISAKLTQNIYIQTQGVEWDITVPLTSLDLLPNVGEKATVYTWLYHREDAVKLFGFASVFDRSVFMDLMKVEGIGAKAAVRILSAIAPKALAAALDAEDMGSIEKIPGVGKKTAQKMMLALKGKLNLEDGALTGFAVRSKNDTAWADVVAALVNMGYEKRLCEETVEKLAVELLQDTAFATKNKTAQEEQLFRRAIVELV